MPRILRRVVCGRGVTIATFSPTRRLSRVDLPTLERPHSTTYPARCSPPPLFIISSRCRLFGNNYAQRLARRRLFGHLFTRSLTDSELAAADADAGDEALGVIGPAFADHFVDRMSAKVTMGCFLQLGLVIAFDSRSTDIVAKQPFHHALGLRQSAVAVNCSDQRFETRSQDRGLLPPTALFLALAEQHTVAQPDGFGLGSQGAGVYDRRPLARQQPLLA